MTCIAIETSTEAFSVTVKHNNQCASFYDIAPRQHAHLLLPTLQQLMQDVYASMSDISLILYGCGPGAFTGVRIAVSAAQGLAFSLGCQTLGVSSLMNLAVQGFKKSSADIAFCAIDARMGEVYFAIYEKVTLNDGTWYCRLMNYEEVVPPKDIFCDDVPHGASCVAIGSGWHSYHEALSHRTGNHELEMIDAVYPDADTLIEIEAMNHLYPQIQETLPEKATPIYLRNSVAKKSRAQVK